MSMSKKRGAALINSAYKRESGRKTSVAQDYLDGGITNVSSDGAAAGQRSLKRQEAIEKARTVTVAGRVAAEKIAAKKASRAKKVVKKVAPVIDDEPTASAPGMGSGPMPSKGKDPINKDPRVKKSMADARRRAKERYAK